jgi:phosphomannomutase
LHPCQLTVTGGGIIFENNMSRLFPTNSITACNHIFQHIAVTHSGFPYGDGQLTGVQLMAVMRRKGKTLKRLAEVMKVYPQTLKNIMVTPEAKAAFATDEGVQNKIKAVEDAMGDSGRVLVRLSGTEPKIRVMLEGEDQQVIEKYADEIIDTIKERLL